MKHLLPALLAMLVLSGCDQKQDAPSKAAPPKASAPKAAMQQDAGPPLTNGMHVIHNACPGEGCSFAFFWRAAVQTPLRDKPAADAAITTTLAPKDLVKAVGAELYVAPWRGVVTGDGQGLKTGDVVYLRDYTGEGHYNLWRRGELLDLDVDAAKVQWDQPLDRRPRAIWWVHLQRDNGQGGWAQGGGFECADLHSGDADCVKIDSAK